jgi:hypothetical protein
MKKFVFLVLSLLIPASALADANVGSPDKNKSYLLTAPGTITGSIHSRKPEQKVEKPAPATQYVQPEKYRYIQDNYNFPQYGTLRARPNPWLDHPAYPPSNMMPPPRMQDFNNPWDVSNLPSLETNGYQNKPVPGEALRTPAYGFYGENYGNSSFYPEFSTPLDRDLNDPSSAAGFPYMNGLMPGLGNDNGNFPFMPFGMF